MSAVSQTGLSGLHRLWRSLPPGPRRRWLAEASALLAPRREPHPPATAPGVIVGGELARPSGLGEGARLMLAALAGRGVPHWRLEAGPGGAETCAAPAGAALVLHVNAPVLPATLLRLPRGLLKGRRLVGYWAWELPTVPPDWRAGARSVHEVWVPSDFSAAALAPLLPGRVRVVPHPLAVAPPRPDPLGREAFGLPAGAVVVLVSFSLASSFARKNPLGAIAAFRAAFGDRADRLLLLKVGHVEHHAADLGTLRAAIAGAANIRLLTAMLDDGARHALTQACDIVLSLHRSEGFGLVPAEAMLLGRPVVATGWSGNLQYMDAQSATLVGYRLVPARDPRGVFEAAGAVWAEPDIGEAAAALARLADDAEARRALGERGRAAATARLGAAALAGALTAIGVTPQ